jgi:hypothetical protein
VRFEHAFVRASVSCDEAVVDPMRGVFALVHDVGWRLDDADDELRVRLAVAALRLRPPEEALATAHEQLASRALGVSVTLAHLDLERGLARALLAGDVRAWLVRRGRVELVVRPQVLSEEHPRAKPEHAHVVTSCLGHDPLRLNRSEFEWPADATLLLGTWHLAERLSLDAILAIAVEEDLGRAVGTLVDAGAPGGAALAVRYGR